MWLSNKGGNRAGALRLIEWLSNKKGNRAVALLVNCVWYCTKAAINKCFGLLWAGLIFITTLFQYKFGAYPNPPRRIGAGLSPSEPVHPGGPYASILVVFLTVRA